MNETMAADFRSQVSDVLRATSISSSNRAYWFGKPLEPASASGIRLAKEQRREVLVLALRRRLYEDFFCAGGAGRTSLPAPRASAGETAEFRRRLRAANTAPSYVDADWLLLEFEGDEVVAARPGLQVWAPLDLCEPGPLSLVPGEQIGVDMPAELPNVSPGYYTACGADWPASHPPNLVRLYWHLTPESAPPLVQTLTAGLSRLRVPFRLKVLNTPSAYVRCDAGVLYVDHADLRRTQSVIEDAYLEVAPFVTAPIPALTKPLAPGLGLAEDPSGSESFGENRCRLLAEALVESAELGERTLNARLARVEAHFRRAGLDLERPYLNPGSRDDYELPIDPAVHTRPLRTVHRTPLLAEPWSNLQASDQIARDLQRTAVWHQGRCNWIGRLPTEPESTGSLPADLYIGTAGIGLFLSELASIVNDRGVENLALGALSHAMQATSAIPSHCRLGLYEGVPGVALSVARAGQVLRKPELLERAASLISATTPRTVDDRQFDVISGRAGAIIGLLTLSRLLRDASLVETAARFGDELLELAIEEHDTLSWRTPSEPRQLRLTGFSHGASGAAYALLLLHEASGVHAYRAAAEAALRYERSWLDTSSGNWQDLRGGSNQRRAQRNPVFATTWCHGAPGMLQTRLLAYQCTGNVGYLDEAGMASRTILQSFAAVLEGAESRDLCLCHGLSGNSEALVSVSSQHLSQLPDMGNDLQGAAARLIQLIQDPDGGLSRRVPGLDSPSLMVGTAGIGHFLLRQARAETPSVCAVRPADF